MLFMNVVAIATAAPSVEQSSAFTIPLSEGVDLSPLADHENGSVSHSAKHLHHHHSISLKVDTNLWTLPYAIDLALSKKICVVGSPGPTMFPPPKYQLNCVGSQAATCKELCWCLPDGGIDCNRNSCYAVCSCDAIT